jgi:ParB family chromosome partitioning protein
MATRFSGYVEAVSVFDLLEVGLISFSSDPIRDHDDEDISGLVASIKEHGLLEPIIVRPVGKRFEVVAGNRRLRACKLLRYRRVKCVITNLDDAEAYEVALAENVQRRTLDPLEEAMAFRNYCEKFGWGSQTKLAKKLGKSQEYISHRLKLLDLPEDVKEELRRGGLNATAAQEMAWLKSEDSRTAALEIVKKSRLNTRSVRRLVHELNTTGQIGPGTDFDGKAAGSPDQEIGILEEAILVMRISLARLDWIMTKVQESELRRVLVSKRDSLNRNVDDLIRLKMSSLGLSHRVPAVASSRLAS